VVEELNMRDLNDLIMSRESASGPREVSKILSIFSDVATAARWLEDHGLMLEDIKPANIGLAKDTEGRERVLFHDLDGLHPIGVTDRLFTYSGDEFAPPEFAGGAIPATGAKEMVYQLGVSLVFTVRLEMTNFSNNMSRESYIDLLTLAEDMVQENPDDRPDLAECKRRFDEINSSMGLEALAA
jgi:serine/threonine protein kinase